MFGLRVVFILLIALVAVVTSLSPIKQQNANCTLTLLNNASEYTLNNGTLQCAVTNTTYSIMGYSVQGSPIVCLLHSSHYISVLEHGISLSVRRLYQSLTIISLFLSLGVSTLSVMCFASVKTISSLVTMSLALSLTMGDATVTLNAFGYDNNTVCTLSAIVEHFSLVAQFSLLAVLGSNFAIRLNHTANGITSSYPEAFFKLLYLCVGWGPSLMFVGVAMLIQSLSGEVQYGHNGFCHLNQPYSILLLLVVPLSIGWIIATISLLGIILYLLKMHCGFDSTDKKQCVAMLMFLVAMAVVIVITVWTLLDKSPLTHVTSLYVCLLANVTRLFLFLVGFMSKEQLMSKVKSSLVRQKRHVHPTPSPSPSSHPYLTPTHSPNDVGQTIASLYPVEAAELVSIMSDPSQVAKIYTCQRCNSIDVKNEHTF